MPDENTQNPKEEKTFTIDQEELEANPKTPVEDPAASGAQDPTQEPANPLNTGDGTTKTPAEPAEAPAEPAEAPAEPAETTPKTPVDITPENPTSETPETPAEPENLEQKLDEQLTDATETAPEAQDATISSKKYLIVVIVVIALLAGGYFIYTYFIAGPSAETEVEEEAETNTLSPTESADETTGEPSEAMEELGEIVDELEVIYSPPAADELEVFEEAVLEEVDDSFPSLTEPVDEPADEPTDEPVEEVVLEEPVLYEPLLGEPPLVEPVIDEPLDLKVLR